MNYKGPGFYRHRKGGIYRVSGLLLVEGSVNKHDQESDHEKHEITLVVYEPMTTPSFLDDRDEKFWGRPLNDEHGEDPFNTPGRFSRIYCAYCGSDDDFTPVGGGMLVCGVCGNNTGTSG